MKQFRCQKCNRLLAKIYDNKTGITFDEIKEIDKCNSKIEIKCPRCQTMNEIEV